MICPVCGSSRVYLKYPANLKAARFDYQITDGAVGQHGDIYKCGDCLLGFETGTELLSSLLATYDKSTCDADYEAETKGRTRAAEKVLKLITQYKPGSRLLDVGCCSGIFLSSAQKNGYEVFGIEPSKLAVDLAHKKGLREVYQGTFETIGSALSDKSYDVITLFDVIEHVADPSAVLNIIGQKLTPGGLLVLGTPNFSSLVSRVQGEKWHAILPHHIYYFSPSNLAILLKKFNFQIEVTTTQTRYFSTLYLLVRLKVYSKIVYKIFYFITKFLHLENFLWPVNLGDQILLIARRS